MAYALITVGSPVRGTHAQNPFVFTAADFELSWSWGLQPAQANIDWVSAGASVAFASAAALTVQLGGQAFYGLVQEVVGVNASSGRQVSQLFVDSRELLRWDRIYASFNIRDPRLVNGIYRPRFRHRLPSDFDAGIWTVTDRPLTGLEILDLIFNAGTVESPWERYYVGALARPVYDLDWEGETLGNCVTAVSERCGCTFTLMGGRYRLVWCLKGAGAVPAFPANSDDRRLGTSLSGHPTRIRVLGEPNQYQVLSCPMIRDWKEEWEEFFDISYLWDDIYRFEVTEAAIGDIPKGTAYATIPDDPEHVSGRQLAYARALTITVGQYADLQDAWEAGWGEPFRDYRKFGGRSRLDMPAALYLKTILFRAFRLPDDFAIRNAYGWIVPRNSLKIVPQALVNISHDPITGQMTWALDEPASSNGYAIVQGYLVAGDAFRTLQPEAFKPEEWVNLQSVWQHAQFQIDDSGEADQFILFDDAVIRSEDLVEEVEIDGVPQGYVALRADPVITSPEVRAALTFTAEPFSYVDGVGTRDGCERVSGLSGQFIWQSGNANLPLELPFADGQTATQKAAEITASLLNRQFQIIAGGYTVRGSNATQLTPVLDRVTIKLNAGGLDERVDFTTERMRSDFEPERAYERRQQLETLLPGHAELKAEALAARLLAAGLRQNPEFVRTLIRSFYEQFGATDRPREVFMDADVEPAEPALPVGTPIWKEAGKSVRVPRPSEVTTAHKVFAGVTVLENERATGPIRTQAHGDVLGRVKGPVSIGDTVGWVAGQNYLVKDGEPGLGSVQDAIADATVHLVKLRLSGAGGGGGPSARPNEFGMYFRGTYDPAQWYGPQDVVEVMSGASAGGYIATAVVPPSGDSPSVTSGSWRVLWNSELGAVWR